MRNLERAPRDIAPEAMESGAIKVVVGRPFRSNLDAVDRTPKGQSNYTAYLGHSALRTYVMGERAVSSMKRRTDDLIAMKRETTLPLFRAGAIGFTTSRTRNHQTARRPSGPASRLANWG